MTAIDEAAIWERALAVPLLRGLDDNARAALGAAAVIRRVRAGAAIFEEHAGGDALYVVAQGAIELRCVRRGDEHASVLRSAVAGDTLGEEAILGLPRRSSAIATVDAIVVELPAALFVRGSGRSGAAAVERERRTLARAATADLLRAHALGRGLAAGDLDLALDAVTWQRFDRGAKIWHEGDPSGFVLLVIDGLVALQTEDDGRVHVRAYLGKGDAFGDDEALAGTPRPTDAVALGALSVLRLPAAVLRTLVDRNPGLRGEIRRIASDRSARQAEVVGAAAAHATQHVFRDLYRMQMARSLLVIDQDSCVRCGHCAWTCASVHGSARLVRRGDKVVTRLPVLGQEPRSLLLPNSCQHCRNAACMIDCPTGAIGRDPQGEVFVRAELCTGCGNCAKACPWENIRMAARAPDERRVAARRGLKLSADVATKCDLCRAYREPACVQTCPTGAILRLDPQRDVAEVAEVLGDRSPAAARTRPLDLGAAIVALGLGACVAAGLVGARRHALGLWSPERGLGWWAGVVAAIAILLATLHPIPKRVLALWLRRRPRRRSDDAPAQGRPRTRVKAFVRAHLVIGATVIAAAIGHAGVRPPAGPAGALAWAVWLTCALGIIGALAYRVVPARLTRIERDGALPEELPGRRRALLDRFYRAATGTDPLVKSLVDRVLVPHARAPLGGLWLVVVGRTLADEEARIHRRIATMLAGRGGDRLAGLPELVRLSVELRAAGARRALTWVLRAFLPLHVIATGACTALLVGHILVVVGR